MYGLAAIGLVVVHRSTGNLDLSQGAAATAAAFTMHRLRIDTGLPAVVAAAVALAVAGAIGLVGAVAARRAGAGRRLAAAVASLAVAGLVLAGCTGLFGGDTQFVPPLVSGGSVRVAGAVLSGHQLLVLAAAVLLVVLGTVVLRRSWVGLAWAGLAGDRGAGFVVGLPVGRLETASYVSAAVLAGAAGILLAPLLFLDTVQMVLFFLVKPFAAAVAAGLVSLPGALVAGLAIGVAESTLVKVQSAPGLGEAVPFVVVVAALGLAARRSGGRGLLREAAPAPLAAGPSRLPGRGAVWPGITVVAALLAVGPHLGPYWSTIVQLGGVTAVLAAAHVVLTGWTGQLSLASPALAGIGAIAAARSATGAGLPFPLPLLVGALAGASAAAVAGVVLGRRVRGVLFAAGTLAFAAACFGALFTLPAFTGTAADRTLDAPRLGSVGLTGPRYTWVVAVVGGVTYALLRALARSRAGAAMVAVREHERAAVALGIPAGSIRWFAFVVSGALAGLAGALTAFQLQGVAVEQFHPLTALPILSVAVVGGIESLWGGVLGAALLTGGPELLRDVSPTLAAALPPAVLLMIVAFRPAGLASLGRIPLLRRTLVLPDSAGEAAPATVSVPEEPGADPLLVEGLAVSFGRFRAVDDMSLAVGPGEVVALIGPNGAGKTTLFDCVSGFVTPDAGRISIGGLRLDRLRPTRRVRAGCGRTFQAGGLCPRLSLRDNVELALRWQRVAGASADGLLAAAGIVSTDAPAAEVPPGIARTAEIVRILALQPRLLLLDEPTAGLNRTESHRLMRLVQEHAARAGVLVIEHDLRVVAGTDRVVVMDRGRLLASGRLEAVRRDPLVIEAYLGPPAGEPAARPAR